MKWRKRKPSNARLLLMALIAMVLFLLCYGARVKVRQPYFEAKMEASRRVRLAMDAIREEKQRLGIEVDPVNDPHLTGMVGLYHSSITTGYEDIDIQIALANPNVAAIFIDLLERANLEGGDRVAVSFTGSYPTLNIALLLACEVLEIEPVVVSSINSITWGANDPDLTWLHLENFLNENGLLRHRSRAVSVGGWTDYGRGMSSKGRKGIIRVAREFGIPVIRENDPAAAVEERMTVYDRESGDGALRAFINLGRGVAALGEMRMSRFMKNGLFRFPEYPESDPEGVIVRMSRRGIPIINIVHMDKLIERYDLPYDPGSSQPIGEGRLFYEQLHSLWVAAASLVVLIFFIILLTRVDFHPLPERIGCLCVCIAFWVAAGCPTAWGGGGPEGLVPRPHSVLLDFESRYDTNIMQYSSSDIEDFQDGARDYRFGQKSLDDVVCIPSFTLYLENDAPGAWRTRLRLKGRFALHGLNEEKDYQSFSAHIRQAIGRGRSVQLGYQYLPRYYVRPVPDYDVDPVPEVDHPVYLPFEYRKRALSAKFRSRIPAGFRMAAAFRYCRKEHGVQFREYDSRAVDWELTLSRRIDKALDLEGQYRFTTSRARGWDEEHENRADSDDVDASYLQNRLSAALILRRARLPLHLRSLELGVTGYIREYTSDGTPEEDPFHAGRRDGFVRLKTTLRWRIIPSSTLEGVHSFETRRIISGWAERYDDIEDVKNYERHLLAVRFSRRWEFDL